MTEKAKVGRPLIFKDKEELKERIEEYFEYCEEREKPLTMSGLAYYLKIDRTTLINYGKREVFFDTIKQAKDRVLMDTEERLQTNGNPTVGIIFSLKNNYNWADKQEIKEETDNKITISWEDNED